MGQRAFTIASVTEAKLTLAYSESEGISVECHLMQSDIRIVVG